MKEYTPIFQGFLIGLCAALAIMCLAYWLA
jgi:hypothetical protein